MTIFPAKACLRFGGIYLNIALATAFPTELHLLLLDASAVLHRHVQNIFTTINGHNIFEPRSHESRPYISLKRAGTMIYSSATHVK